MMLRRSRRPRSISIAVLKRLMNVGLVDGGMVEAGESAEVLHNVGHALDPCRVLRRIFPMFSLT